jgi:WD40 repeat protein
MRLQDRKRVVAAVRFSPDGHWVAAASYGGRLMVWTASGDSVVGIPVSKKNLSTIAFSPDGASLAVGGLGGDVSVWTLPVGERTATLVGHSTAVLSLSYGARGCQLVSLGYEQTVRIWDASTWVEQRVFRVPEPRPRGLALSPDGRTAAVTVEGQITLRSLDDWTELGALPASVKALYSATYSPDGTWLAAGAADGNIRVWRA